MNAWILLSLIACGWNAGTELSARPAVQLDPAPAPIVSGTIVVRDELAIVVDPDRDEVHAVTRSGQITTTHLGPRPTRAVIDDAARVHVLLDGAIATIDRGAEIRRAATCRTARGLAFDPARAALFVSCGSGAILELDAATLTRRATIYAPIDLGDLLVRGDRLIVARARAAEVLSFDTSSGQLLGSFPLRQGVVNAGEVPVVLQPHAIRRLVDAGSRGVLVVHGLVGGPQAAPSPEGYESAANQCARQAIVVATTLIDPERGNIGGPTPHCELALPTDGAIDAQGRLALVDASTFGDALRDHPAAILVEGATSPILAPGQATSVAFFGDGTPIVQAREPAALLVGDRVIPLSAVSQRDTGHDLLYTRAGDRTPCAACHLDGGDDGRLWPMEDGSTRRTPTLRGGLSKSAPYHADGSLRDMRALMTHHFPRGDHTSLRDDELEAFATFVDALPPDPAPFVDPSVATLGEALYRDLACASCHGERGLDPSARSFDLGRGARQAPPLHELAYRTLFGADGCARTLEGFFTRSCGGEPHAVSSDVFAPLAAYLGSLDGADDLGASP